MDSAVAGSPPADAAMSAAAYEGAYRPGRLDLPGLPGWPAQPYRPGRVDRPGRPSQAGTADVVPPVDREVKACMVGNVDYLAKFLISKHWK